MDKKKNLAIYIIALIIINFTNFPKECKGQTPLFKATFEEGLNPEVGSHRIETKNGAKLERVANPFPNLINSSSYVIKSTIYKNEKTLTENGRAEYSSGKVITENEKVIYKFDIYMPSDLRTGLTGDYTMVMSQFKTNPCSNSGILYGEEYDFDDEICWGMGIYNDFRIKPDYVAYRLRAYPDCKELPMYFPTGKWVNYVIETYWTNSKDGYTHVYEDGELTYSQTNIKTLMDGWIEGECDVFWALGLYTRLPDKDSLHIYIDNMYVYDGDTYSIDDVCEICSTGCKPFDLTALISDEIENKKNGEIDINIIGGNTPYSFSWDDGSSLEDRDNLSKGVYSVTVTDSKGCMETHNWTISNTLPNSYPILHSKYNKIDSLGGIYRIDASGTEDPDGDVLSYSWITPTGIDVSSNSGNIIEFIAPQVADSSVLPFILNVSDGQNPSVTDTISIVAKNERFSELAINSTSASTDEEPNISKNVYDNDDFTRWSAKGTDEYIILKASSLTNLSHIGISFYNRIDSKAMFDIFSSSDGSRWNPELLNLKSCGFSDKMHIYPFHSIIQDSSIVYLKIVGKGNTMNDWNSFTEVKLFNKITDNSPPIIKLKFSSNN